MDLTNTILGKKAKQKLLLHDSIYMKFKNLARWICAVRIVVTTLGKEISSCEGAWGEHWYSDSVLFLDLGDVCTHMFNFDHSEYNFFLDVW